MPAINVARTDTFEQQRVKINEIGTQLFSISAGGSDLSAGNIKLGDGTRSAPSLAFVSDNQLGLYKADNNTLGFVSNTKKLIDFNDINTKTYKDFVFQKKVLLTDGITITSPGSGYDEGTYELTPLVGGTGDGAVATLIVEGFTGNILNNGTNYNPGQFTGIDLIGGNGTGATCEFVVEELEGGITNTGSGYPPGAYLNVPTTSSGSGTGATLDLTVTGTTDLTLSINNAGTGGNQGSYPSVSIYNVPRQTYVVTVIGDGGGTPYEYVIDGVTRPTLSFERGNTYRFDVSDPSVIGHPLFFHGAGDPLNQLPDQFTQVVFGSEGTAGAFYDLVVHTDAPNAVGYGCASHANMGQVNNTVTTGAETTSGRNATATVDVDVNGSVTDVVISDPGTGYNAGDQIQFIAAQIGSTTGVLVDITAVSFVSSVSAAFVNQQGQDYVSGEVLSASNVNIGGVGSGFEFTITSDPGIISEFDLTTFGSGYTVGDTLGLPQGVTGLTTVLPGTITGISTTLTAGVSQITVADTSNLAIGMNIFNGQGDVGFVAQGAVISSIDSATTLTMSFPADTSGAASLTFTSPNTQQINVTSVVGIAVGDGVTQTAGSGVLAPGTTVQAIDATVTPAIITLSAPPTSPGSATLSFAPTFGLGSTPFSFQITALGTVGDVTITDGGNGYSVGDTLTAVATNLIQPIDRVVKWYPIQTLTFTTNVADAAISVGDTIKQRDGGVGNVGFTSGTSILAEANATYNGVAASGSTGTGLTLNVFRGGDGAPSAVVDNGGYGYTDGDTVTVAGNLVGGASPADDVVFTIQGVTTFTDFYVAAKDVSGGNIQSLVVYDLTSGGDTDFTAGSTVIINGAASPSYVINTASSVGTESKIFIDGVITPDLSFYVGNTYKFDISDGSNGAHNFGLSEFEGGDKAPSSYTGYAVTLSETDLTVTLNSTVGLLAGMLVSSTGAGSVPVGTKIASVDGPSQITLDTLPDGAGASILAFTGAEYTEGVTKTVTDITIKITSDTPTLYYYDIGDGGEAEAGKLFGVAKTITMDPNNPRTFGSGFVLTVDTVDSTDIIKGSIISGDFAAETFTAAASVNSLDANITGTLTAPDIDGTALDIATITGTDIVTTATSYTFHSLLNIGEPNLTPTLTVDNTNGDLTSQGTLKAITAVNVNDQLEIVNNEVRSLANLDLVLKPVGGRKAMVNTTTAFGIPAGVTADRPPLAQLVDGLIRFNTETNQYEGYSSTSSAWSSLGGVRDIDGNTYILAEETTGANDNKLWFYNDAVLSLRVTKDWLEFLNADAIRSLSTTAPAYTDWVANAPVTAGDYLKYKSDIYLVTISGTTATSGSEPSDTSGNPFVNGSATLQWHETAVKDLLFSEIAELKVGNTTDTVPLSINGDLKLQTNVISTQISDLLLRPNTGNKIKCDAVTSFVIPVGSENDKGSAETGSIRYNTTNQNFEGFNGAQWGSLGGVKDVDQNTYIIPETSPGANENILYFYNDNIKTVELTTTELRLTGINTITTPFDNSLEVTADTFTLAQNETTIDNTNADRSILSTSKQYFDLALSTGLNVDPVLRLDDQGDVYLNTGFGTGVFDGVKIFDKDLSAIEISNYKITTAVTPLTKGTTNSGAAVLYDPLVDRSSRVEVIVHNTSSGAKEFIELSVLDDGVDIYFTEIGTVQTANSLVDYTLDFNVQGNVRFNFTLSSNVTNAQNVNITVVSRVIKK